MANAINIPKTHLIMGLSLPLAVLLGYFVAEPMELGSMAVVVFVLVVISIPLLMKWYYPLLVFFWNSAFCALFLPGGLALWSVMAFIALLFAVLSRAVSPDARFVIEPSVTTSLLVLAGVVVATGLLTGGFGVRMLGSSQYGGKKYFCFLSAVAGYFAFTSRRIPPHQAGFYTALFFLSALSYALGDLAAIGGPKLAFLSWFVSAGSAVRDADLADPLRAEGVRRIGEFLFIAPAFYCFLLARFGVRGLLDLTRPWRLLLLFLALGMGLLSGFRSFVLLSGLTFAGMFYLEGLHRTRYATALLGFALLGGAVVLPQADKLPLAVQRALTFLPGKFDYKARFSAESTSEWRLQMWKELLPAVSKCLLRGQGWGIDAGDFSTGVEMADPLDTLSGTKLTGDYHNGPLSILMPFGLYGMVAFVWFLTAALRVLYRNWKFGDPTLQNLNALLLASFAGRAFFFFSVFGGLHSDMSYFVGLLGLSVALNGAQVSVAKAAQPAAGVGLNTEYIKA
jgi:O-antigen ligase